MKYNIIILRCVLFSKTNNYMFLRSWVLYFITRTTFCKYTNCIRHLKQTIFYMILKFSKDRMILDSKLCKEINNSSNYENRKQKLRLQNNQLYLLYTTMILYFKLLVGYSYAYIKLRYYSLFIKNK